jgi:acetyl-CoA synthetase
MTAWPSSHRSSSVVPVIDHMWQAETCGPVFGNPYGVGMLPIKPGSSASGGTRSLCARLLGPHTRGLLQRRFRAYRRGRIRLLWRWRPCRRDHQDRGPPHRHHRSRKRVSEAFRRRRCGVVRRPDDLRGEVISAFVLLKHGHAPSTELRKALIDTIRHELGPAAVIGEMNFVGMLPKTRSGKIMRRVLKAVILDAHHVVRRVHCEFGADRGRRSQDDGCRSSCVA